MTALALIPFVLAFAWIALEGRRWGALACAAVFSAAVVANNFYGATALAIFYPILVFSLWVTQGGWQVLVRALAIPALAYGLCAFWLTPSYLRITRQNMRCIPAGKRAVGGIGGTGGGGVRPGGLEIWARKARADLGDVLCGVRRGADAVGGRRHPLRFSRHQANSAG